MTFPEYLHNWITKAEEDLTLVDHEMHLEESKWITNAIGFHCQQAVEKLLKAFLIANEKEPEKTHNLEKLLVEAGKVNSSLLDIDLADLTDFAVDSRYPV